MKMSKVKNIGISILLVLISLQIVAADLCTIKGYVFYKGGEPVEEGEELYIHYPYYEFSYETKTGEVWPYPNFYAYTFTCRQQKDNIVLEIKGEKTDVMLNSGLIEQNFTLSQEKPKEPKEIVENETEEEEVEKLQDAGGGGSSGGGGGGPSSYKLPIIGKGLEEDEELTLIYSEDWLDLSRYIIKVLKVEKGSAKFILMEQDNEFTLDIGEYAYLDLDDDKQNDIKLNLDEIDDGKAYVSIEKIIAKPLLEETPGSIAEPNISDSSSVEREDEAPDKPYLPKNLKLFLLILTLLLTILLYIQIRMHKKGDKSGYDE